MSVSDDGWTLVNFETVDLNLVELSVLNKATNQLCVVSGTSASILNEQTSGLNVFLYCLV